jgi:glycosyltransferase involved in cell wall biosynthesis
MVAFSVAIPTYNRADLLGATLDAVLGQSSPPAEIVVVDDGSTDDTSAVLRRYGPAVVVKRIANAGPGAARKAAIEACRHEWVALCDSDDLWLPHHLERRRRLIEAFPEATFTFSNFREFGPGARYPDKFASLPESWWRPFPATDEGFRLLGCDAFVPILRANPVFPSTTAFQRGLYDRIGGIRAEISRVCSEDADLTRRCAARGVVACDTAITVEIRKHGGNYSAEEVRNLLGRADLLARLAADPSLPEHHRSEVLAELATTRVRAARQAFQHRDFASFADLYRAIPPHERSLGLAVKMAFARLPEPARRPLIHLATLSLGAFRSRSGADARAGPA